MENRIIHTFVYALSGAVLGLILIPVSGDSSSIHKPVLSALCFGIITLFCHLGILTFQTALKIFLCLCWHWFR